MPIVEFDGLPSWSLDASEKKSPWVGGGGVNSVWVKERKNRETARASPSRVYGVSRSVQQRQHLIGLRDSRVHQSTAGRWHLE